ASRTRRAGLRRYPFVMTKTRVPFMGALAATCALAGSCPAFACVNTFETEIQRLQAEGDPASVAAIVNDLVKKHDAQPTLENSNDLGVARLLTGKTDAAIALFRETEKKFPGNARVAANLGTALDLKGENIEALTWIKR